MSAKAEKLTHQRHRQSDANAPEADVNEILFVRSCNHIPTYSNIFRTEYRQYIRVLRRLYRSIVPNEAGLDIVARIAAHGLLRRSTRAARWVHVWSAPLRVDSLRLAS